jgi:hypothetical protein
MKLRIEGIELAKTGDVKIIKASKQVQVGRKFSIEF